MTDHSALVWLMNMKEPTGKYARWIMKAQEFDFEIVHKPGRKHTNADSISRVLVKLDTINTMYNVIADEDD